MNYCFRYYKGSKYLNKVKEIIIMYKPNDRLEDFLINRENQRIILDLTKAENDSEVIEFLSKYNRHKNLTLLLSLTQKNICGAVLNMGLPYFFIESPKSMAELEEFVKMGVSDVYITDDFAYQIREISKFCKSADVKIRVFPNVAQSDRHDLSAFFILPNEVSLYHKYIDCFEFYGPIDRQSVLYEIYNEGEWNDSIGYVILDMNEDIGKLNGYTLTHLNRVKLNCDLLCQKGIDCKQCRIMEKMSNIWAEGDG